MGATRRGRASGAAPSSACGCPTTRSQRSTPIMSRARGAARAGVATGAQRDEPRARECQQDGRRRDPYRRRLADAWKAARLNVLLGPTLSGKTSLMRLMAGLDKPTPGRVLVDGKDVTGAHVRDRSVAMVYQQFINYPTLTVYENIASPLRVAGHPEAEIEREVKEAARLLKLEPLLDRTPLELSGGQQQRTAIARAIVKRAVARAPRRAARQSRLQAARGIARGTAAASSRRPAPSSSMRRPSRTRRCCSAAARRRCGKAASRSSGRTPLVYRRPDDLVTAQVFSDPPMNVMPIEKRGPSVALPTGETVAGDGRPRRHPQRPLHRRLSSQSAVALARPAPDAIRLPGTVAVTEISGSESFVHVEYAGLRFVALTAGVHEVEPGAVDRHLRRSRPPFRLRRGRPSRRRSAPRSGRLRTARWPRSRSRASPTPTSRIRQSRRTMP